MLHPVTQYAIIIIYYNTCIIIIYYTALFLNNPKVLTGQSTIKEMKLIIVFLDLKIFDIPYKNPIGCWSIFVWEVKNYNIQTSKNKYICFNDDDFGDLVVNAVDARLWGKDSISGRTNLVNEISRIGPALVFWVVLRSFFIALVLVV